MGLLWFNAKIIGVSKSFYRFRVTGWYTMILGKTVKSRPIAYAALDPLPPPTHLRTHTRTHTHIHTHTHAHIKPTHHYSQTFKRIGGVYRFPTLKFTSLHCPLDEAKWRYTKWKLVWPQSHKQTKTIFDYKVEFVLVQRKTIKIIEWIGDK